MKAILTLIFVILFGALAVAQNAKTLKKVPAYAAKTTIVTADKSEIKFKKVKLNSGNDIALVFRFRNALIKDSLAFTTSTSRSRLV